ncbi:hypothetical protein PPEP_b0131 [Pseudoalteromonas peptidolytica F12-50-A1]|uniref:Uncharacterized protein n=1 Tax=Pseudoalteromonas peptidolytica F12-50-A1 TaxID=1315280 RepID=A0A8I0N0P2_9GAMM|nr:hypothetical protein [Pseudoalteromonas peptidolytica F12-50-A1]
MLISGNAGFLSSNTILAVYFKKRLRLCIFHVPTIFEQSSIVTLSDLSCWPITVVVPQI